MEPEPRAEMYANMDAANIDLKGFSDVFYRRFTGGRLAPVLDTLGYLVHQTNCWVEITTLLISGLNDSTNELEALTNWIVENLGVDIPLHFTAFHPAHRLANHPPTLLADLDRARKIAHDQGLRYVYSGNVPDLDGSTTHCGSCGISLVERQGFTVTSNLIKADGLCPMCRQMVPGQWCDQPAAHDA
ncbi:MAG: AmmeMemoRadiSam system radical SAM enzyme [Bifidobacteriaceae bacterium]|nr:AmmeMemoRadiSam system radical SAM enzyme [Bifidobacteriaceae bacterium]